MKEYIAEVKINNISELDILASKLSSGFAFRGQSDSSWDLSTSLERAIKKYSPLKIDLLLLKNREHWMLHEFKRKFEIYSINPPPPNDNFEWLSIMQHYGSPTRLLDFTHSFYIASYFAVSPTNQESAIWCVNLRRLRDSVCEKFNYKIDHENLGYTWNREYINIANKHLIHKGAETDIIIPVEPTKANKRLALQQGLFLIPLNSKETFMENMFSSFKNLKKESIPTLIHDLKSISDEFYILKIIVPDYLSGGMCKKLLNMNITAETLFSGLDGLANSLIQVNIRDGL